MRTTPIPGTGPDDWVPPDDGPPCVCTHGEWKHRGRQKQPPCYLCPCKRYRAAQEGLGL